MSVARVSERVSNNGKWNMMHFRKNLKSALRPADFINAGGLHCLIKLMSKNHSLTRFSQQQMATKTIIIENYENNDCDCANK